MFCVHLAKAEAMAAASIPETKAINIRTLKLKREKKKKKINVTTKDIKLR